MSLIDRCLAGSDKADTEANLQTLRNLVDSLSMSN